MGDTLLKMSDRLHVRLGNLLTVKQICTGVNKVVLRQCRLQVGTIWQSLARCLGVAGQVCLACTSDIVNVLVDAGAFSKVSDKDGFLSRSMIALFAI